LTTLTRASRERILNGSSMLTAISSTPSMTAAIAVATKIVDHPQVGKRPNGRSVSQMICGGSPGELEENRVD
jgi:hypothetical protein